jgi:serine protease AprX
MGIRGAYFVIFLLLFIQFLGNAQEKKYMVFFRDKKQSQYLISEPNRFLSARAIQRRQHQQIKIDDTDLPVNTDYINKIASKGVKVLYKTKWFNGVLVQCDDSKASELLDLPFVKGIEYVSPVRIDSRAGRTKTLSEVEGNTVTTGTSTKKQLTMLGIDVMHHDGFKGKGITIAVFDAGFEGVDTVLPFQHLWQRGAINAGVSYNFVNQSNDVFTLDDHGTQVLSIMGALIPNEFVGGAYESNFQLYVTEDVRSEYRIEEYNWLFAAERADSAGVDIINSSLGYYLFDDPAMNYTPKQMDGKTAVVTKAAELASQKGILVVASAGNTGSNTSWQIITAPADGEHILAVANVDSNGARSITSGIGPSADGRIKPDVAALGINARAIDKNGSREMVYGTSFSAPLVASLAAGVWQRYPFITSVDLINALKENASLASRPNTMLGYGIPDFSAIVEHQDALIAILNEIPFEAYPNPTRGVIRFNLHQHAKAPKVVVYDSQGNLQYEDRLNKTPEGWQHDLIGMPNGQYLVKVIFEQQPFIFRVTKVE